MAHMMRFQRGRIDKTRRGSELKAMPNGVEHDHVYETKAALCDCGTRPYLYSRPESDFEH